MMNIEEVKVALNSINSGQWLQMEGSVGRYCNSFIEAGIIVKDEKETKKKGPVVFTDGYGRKQSQYRFKIDHEKFDELKENVQ